MNNVNQLVVRAITDESFCKKFLEDPVKAAEGFELSHEEIAQLKEINLFELVQIHTVLEERLSKSFINLPEISQSSPWHTSHSNSSSDPLHTSSGGNGPGHNSYYVDNLHDSTSHSSW